MCTKSFACKTKKLTEISSATRNNSSSEPVEAKDKVLMALNCKSCVLALAHALLQWAQAHNIVLSFLYPSIRACSADNIAWLHMAVNVWLVHQIRIIICVFRARVRRKLLTRARVLWQARAKAKQLCNKRRLLGLATGTVCARH